MKRIAIALSAFALAVVGCTKDENNDPDPPAIGSQIDLSGRPGISTALIGAFNPDDTASAALKNGYNEGPNNTASNIPEIMTNLAVLDSLDVPPGGTSVCGNQVLADADPGTRYGFLATVLSNDKLWLNTATTQSCVTEVQVFLAVEAAAGALVPGADQLCGGRAPTQDVIATLYTVLVQDDLGSPIDDTILEDPDGVPDDDAFPFLTAPN